MRTLKRVWGDSSLPWRIAYVIWLVWTAAMLLLWGVGR